jgi:hypothetical protein
MPLTNELATAAFLPRPPPQKSCPRPPHRKACATKTAFATSPSLTAWRPASICGTVVGLVATAPTGTGIGGTLWGVSLVEGSLDTGSRASNRNPNSTRQSFDRIQPNLKKRNLHPSAAAAVNRRIETVACGSPCARCMLYVIPFPKQPAGAPSRSWIHASAELSSPFPKRVRFAAKT